MHGTVERWSVPANESNHSDSPLRGSVRYGRVIPLGNMRTLSLEWSEDFDLTKKTAEEVTFSIEARMRRTLQEAGIVR